MLAQAGARPPSGCRARRNRCRTELRHRGPEGRGRVRSSPRSGAATPAIRQPRQATIRARTRRLAMATGAASGQAPAPASSTAAPMGSAAPARISGAKATGKGGPPQTCPPQLTPPHLSGAAVAERLREGPCDEADPKTRGPNDLGGGGVLRNLSGEAVDAAGTFEDVGAPEHRLALCETDAELVGDQLPARLEGIEPGAFHLGPETVRVRSDRRRADEARILPPAFVKLFEIVRRHQDVAVRHDPPRMASGPPTLHEIVELRIDADAVIADEEPRVGPWMGGDQPPDEGYGRVALCMGAEESARPPRPSDRSPIQALQRDCFQVRRPAAAPSSEVIRARVRRVFVAISAEPGPPSRPGRRGRRDRMTRSPSGSSRSRSMVDASPSVRSTDDFLSDSNKATGQS